MKIHRHTHPTTGRHRPRQRHPVDQLPRIRKKSPIQPHRRSRRIGHLHPRHPPGPAMVHFTQPQRTGRRQTARLIRRPRRGRGKNKPLAAARRLASSRTAVQRHPHRSRSHLADPVRTSQVNLHRTVSFKAGRRKVQSGQSAGWNHQRIWNDMRRQIVRITAEVMPLQINRCPKRVIKFDKPLTSNGGRHNFIDQHARQGGG